MVKEQMSEQLELTFENRGEAPKVERSVQTESADDASTTPGSGALMEEIVERSNMQRALERVTKNKGSAGIDGMTVDELPDWLRFNWPQVREDLLAGRYRPSPVRRVTIPKPDGGERQLGIPTVLDRLIQQAVLQVLQPRIDPTFSDRSHGFRPGRSAHGAIREARSIIQGGKTWVVDIDLEKFFDRVNHDVLMGRMAKRIEDRRVLKLIRGYLNAGVMVNGVVHEQGEGTPQGGPLSPLLANVLLDEIDKKLETRGHAFVRYADDLRVFVASKKAGERCMQKLVKDFEALRLKVNHEKSAVDKAWRRPFLGFAFWVGKGKQVKLRVAPKALQKMKARVRQITRRNAGRSLPSIIIELRTYLLGWRGYFRLAETPRVFSDLDGWIRHRLRAIQLKMWKRGKTVFRELVARGMSKTGAAEVASQTKRWWKNSAMKLNVAIPNHELERLGLPRLGR
jgi:group II intron reverse transcriptase/maturase